MIELDVTKEDSSLAVRDLPTVHLTFDVVIATRNRPEALALSIPLILGQSRKPGRLIVIDSSSDHSPVVQVVNAAVTAATDWSGEVIVEHSDAGAALQRNRGFRHVTSDVVFFPDDDSLFHPGASGEIMSVYERDPDGRIAGVCTRDAVEPPAGVLPDNAYRMTSAQKRERRTMALQTRIARRIKMLNPFMYMGQLFMQRWSSSGADLGWMPQADCVLVEFMTGFRMTFRAGYFRAIGGFDETLRGYAVVEDVDACFGVSIYGCLVGARKAGIYHHKFPSPRAGGYAIGAKIIMNRTYITAKHISQARLSASEARTARRMMRIYCWFKAARALMDCRSAYGRDHLRGTIAAWRQMTPVLEAPRDELVARYERAMARIGVQS